MAALRLFYSPSYCLEDASFDTLRKPSWVAASLVKRPIEQVELVAPAPLDVDALEGVHDAAYVEAIERGKPRWLAESPGFPWHERLWTAVTHSNGGVVSAALHALSTRSHSGSLSCGLHHARFDRGDGYCTFNGLALAVHAVQQAGAERVLLLDFDAHGSGGTWSLLSGARGVTCLDVCTYDFDRYASGRGWKNVLVTHAASYVDVIARELEVLRASDFDVCLYNAGMDPCELSDQGMPGIKASALATRERLVFDWARAGALPVCFVLAGGYLSPKLDRGGLVSLHRETVRAAVT